METEVVTYSKYKKLNSNILKIIAITAMTPDHLAWALWPGFSANPVALLTVIGILLYFGVFPVF